MATKHTKNAKNLSVGARVYGALGPAFAIGRSQTAPLPYFRSLRGGVGLDLGSNLARACGMRRVRRRVLTRGEALQGFGLFAFFVLFVANALGVLR
jgi:hypothetical protein